MSVQEFRKSIYALADQFQVALGAVELALLELLPPEVRKQLLMAQRQLHRGVGTLRRMQALVDLIAQEEQENIQ